MEQVSPNHPAVRKVLTRLSGHNKDLQIKAVFERAGAVGVVADSESFRYQIVVELLDGEWKIPDTITKLGHRQSAPRPARTAAPPMLSQKHTTATGWPLPDGSPPSEMWCVVTGVAALDALSVTVSTRLEQQLSPVGADGFVGVMIRKHRQEKPQVTVQTPNGPVDVI